MRRILRDVDRWFEGERAIPIAAAAAPAARKVEIAVPGEKKEARPAA